MTDQLISFETAKLAKEKGFNEECIYYYSNKTGILKPFMFDDNPKVISIQNGTNAGLLTIAPTQSLLQKWLRDKHNIHIYISTTPKFDKLQGSKYKAAIDVPFQPFKWTTGHYYLGNTYEEALEQGLQEALKLI
jgi:hypothetical protein